MAVAEFRVSKCAVIIVSTLCAGSSGVGKLYALFRKTTTTVIIPFKTIQNASMTLFCLEYSFFAEADTGEGSVALSSLSFARTTSTRDCMLGPSEIDTPLRTEDSEFLARAVSRGVIGVIGEGERAAIASAKVLNCALARVYHAFVAM